MMRVEGHKHLFREDSGAIVNTDTHQYNEYIRMRSERKKQREEIDGLKNDISEIKSLLMEIINGPRHDSTRNNDQNV
jgi:SPX domain protein involved in polyphosphate accumulation